MACFTVHTLIVHSFREVVRLYTGVDDTRIFLLLLKVVADFETVE